MCLRKHSEIVHSRPTFHTDSKRQARESQPLSRILPTNVTPSRLAVVNICVWVEFAV
ncbi:hypothetical protein EYZ11_006778 [Aspergillus tanneri]|uniref:Uncharacterized protein n=1 Tax=Aspergillus tanneri TaxID=1220188 RepID=A0A4S3JH15_9EURO|nr:hypothetical protein EYZ11_006778 [Aspergillus tanneri]